MPPLPGSPAVDQGNATYPTDQRGRERWYDNAFVLNAVGGDAADVGAYELRPGLHTVTTLAEAGAGSLRQAVADLHPYDADSIKVDDVYRAFVYDAESGGVTDAHLELSLRDFSTEAKKA